MCLPVRVQVPFVSIVVVTRPDQNEPVLQNGCFLFLAKLLLTTLPQFKEGIHPSQNAHTDKVETSFDNVPC